MTSLEGLLLVARPELVDPNFRRTVVSILIHNDEGAVGVVLNRPAQGFDLVGVEVGSQVVEAALHFGGPVDAESIVVVGERPDGGPSLLNDDDDGGSDAMRSGMAPVRAYLGHAGWEHGQLESEMEEGAWIACRPRPGDHVAPEPELLWRDVLARQAAPTRMLAWYPHDLSAN